MRRGVTQDVLTLASEGYAPIEFAAYMSDRPERTLWTWVRAGVVRTLDLPGGKVVHLSDVARLSAERNRRVRLPATCGSA